MDQVFEKELLESGYLHRPLPLHRERSLEADMEKKPVLKLKDIWKEGMKEPVHTGIGTVTVKDGEGREGGASLRIVAPTSHDIWTYGSPEWENEEEKAFYHAMLQFPVDRENWEQYNRLSFWVKPDSPGSRAVHLRCYLQNAGEHPVPDAYHREGQFLANLVNHEWNHVIWECALLPKDCVTEFSIKMDADGQDTSTGDYFLYDFDQIRMETIAEPELERGWECQKGYISYSMSGYYSDGRKIAIINPQDLKTAGNNRFQVMDENGRAILEREVKAVSERMGSYGILDFSEITKPGWYRVEYDGLFTGGFRIGPDVMEEATWKVLNFIYCERCGYPIPGKHGRCHMDVIARHKGLIMPYGGGWHDAGDMSQQSLQTAEVMQELFELAEHRKDDTLLYQRLMEEALWGLEFTLKTRFKDGYRASSVGLGMWTGGLIGDRDDVETRVHNQAFQNFFCGAVEAYAAIALKDYDADLAWKCGQAAREDYQFAKARYDEFGMELPIMWEHTLNSGKSQYYATAAWAAANIYQATCDEAYILEAENWGAKLMACQETGTEEVPMKGFFYRDECHKAMVHFTHQGRDHSFVQALEALCRALPDSTNKGKWEASMRLYGEYLKELSKLAEPYGMLPAGLHSITEAEDEENFKLLHLQVEFLKEQENYREQLRAGIDLGGGYYVRRFPVWFSFRGNSAIHLGMGKAAALIGSYFQDRELTDIGREQLYWVSGKNPFCQSLMYGEGKRYAQQDANYPGEMTGEVPVGIQTMGNEDIPYWPAGNNATYKEVWLTPAGRWLSIMASL